MPLLYFVPTEENKTLIANCPILREPFYSTPWLPGSHAQVRCVRACVCF